MAVTKQDVLSFIAENITSARKTVPAKDIVAHFGSDATEVINQLKKDGTIKGKRGRTGGLFPADAAAEQSQSAVQTNEVADQFAALMAKLEADEAADAPVDLFADEPVEAAL